MGIVYDGAYTDDVNFDAFHEGYAARLWPDGTLGATWGGEFGWTGHSGLVGACACGWRGRGVYDDRDGDNAGELAAERDFKVEHLQPLIEAAKQRSWPQWTARVAARANDIGHLVQWGRLGDARDLLDTLRDDLARRAVMLADLDAVRPVAANDDADQPAGRRPFPPLSEDPPPGPVEPLTPPPRRPSYGHHR